MLLFEIVYRNGRSKIYFAQSLSDMERKCRVWGLPFVSINEIVIN